MRIAKLSIIILILGFSVSCKKNTASDLYIPTASDVTATATLQELQDGRTLYMNNCGSCHSLYSPDDFSANAWNSIMSSMANKTRMSSSEVNLVKKYVTRGK
jgi:hypothetical protein